MSKLEKADILVRFAFINIQHPLVVFFLLSILIKKFSWKKSSDCLLSPGVDRAAPAQDGPGPEVVRALPPRGPAEVPGGVHQLRQRGRLLPPLRARGRRQALAAAPQPLVLPRFVRARLQLPTSLPLLADQVQLDQLPTSLPTTPPCSSSERRGLLLPSPPTHHLVHLLRLSPPHPGFPHPLHTKADSPPDREELVELYQLLIPSQLREVSTDQAKCNPPSRAWGAGWGGRVEAVHCQLTLVISSKSWDIVKVLEL